MSAAKNSAADPASHGVTIVTQTRQKETSEVVARFAGFV